MKNRMVCECYGITVDDIRAELVKGACGFEELERTMRLGVLCGACINDAKKVINSLQNEIDEGL